MKIRFESPKERNKYFAELFAEINRTVLNYNFENGFEDEPESEYKERLCNIRYILLSFIKDCPPNINEGQIPEKWEVHFENIADMINLRVEDKLNDNQFPVIINYIIPYLNLGEFVDEYEENSIHGKNVNI